MENPGNGSRDYTPRIVFGLRSLPFVLGFQIVAALTKLLCRHLSKEFLCASVRRCAKTSEGRVKIVRIVRVGVQQSATIFHQGTKQQANK